MPWAVGVIAALGAAPILGLALAVWGAPRSADLCASVAIAYGGVLLGFLGGVRWGAELVRAPGAPSLWRLSAAGLAVAPGVAVVLLTAQRPLALGLLAVAGLLCLAWDVAAARAGLLPRWTGPLRLALTAASLVGLGAIAARI
jgi:hypothetical protein